MAFCKLKNFRNFLQFSRVFLFLSLTVEIYEICYIVESRLNIYLFHIVKHLGAYKKRYVNCNYHLYRAAIYY